MTRDDTDSERPSPTSSGASPGDTPKHGAGVDPKLLEILVCPLTKTTLIYDREKSELISKAAGLAFPIRNGVPLLIEDAARPLCDTER